MDTRRRFLHRAALLCAGSLAVGCGGGGGTEPPPPVAMPTLVIRSNAIGTVDAPFDVSFSFSGAVTAFGADRFLLNGGRQVPGSFTQVSASEYTVQITPFENSAGEIRIEVFATAFKDGAGTAYNTETYRFTQPYDTLRPEPWVSFTDSQPGLLASGPVTVTMQFNLDVSPSFALEDLYIVGGLASGFTRVSATTYTLVMTPLPEARSMEIELPEGAVTAAVPNGVANSRSWSWFKFMVPG